MKYAMNHPWKFEKPILAFFVGFMQSLVVFVIELINYVLLVGLNTHMDILLGFITLIFVIHFGNFFFQSIADPEYKKIISGLNDKYHAFLKIQTKTTPRFSIFRVKK